MIVAPATDYLDELLPQQRAAILIYHLTALRRCYTTEEVARLVGLTRRGALYLLDNLSAVHGLPLTRVDGHWMILR